jgi:hypothetical protein
VCYILHKELSKHFPTGRGHGSVIGSFYMLRFICPALVSPVKMGFVDSTLYPVLTFSGLDQREPLHLVVRAGQQNNNLPAEVMRHLVAVAKLLQSLANTSMQASFLQVPTTSVGSCSSFSRFFIYSSPLTFSFSAAPAPACVGGGEGAQHAVGEVPQDQDTPLPRVHRRAHQRGMLYFLPPLHSSCYKVVVFRPFVNTEPVPQINDGGVVSALHYGG